MRSLLVFPPFPDHRSEYPPLGIAYIAAFLKKNMMDVDAVDLSILKPNAWSKVLERKMRDFSPEVVGISAMTSLYNSALKVGKYIKNHERDVKVMFGGHHPTIFPELTLKNSFIDFVIRGEGEETFLELVKFLESGKNLLEIKGLSFKQDGKPINNPPRPFINDLDGIPFPLRDLFDLEEYPYFPMMNIISSRGCPYSCYFCFKGMFGHIFRARSPGNVIDEIEYLMGKYDSREFYFVDDLFTFDKDRVKKICQSIREKGLEIKWKCFSRINLVDQDLLNEMKEAGCTTIHYGIETGDPNIMPKIKKGISLKQAEEVVRMTEKSSIMPKAYFMIGHPWDTEKTIKNTIEFTKKMGIDKVQFSLTTPFPGTELWEIAKKMGVVSNNLNDINWDNLLLSARYMKPLMRTYELSPERLVYWLKRAEKEWYKHKLLSSVKTPRKTLKIIKYKGMFPLLKIIFKKVIKWQY